MRRSDPQKQAQRREQIISIAAELFANQNFHEVLMEEVARRAGLSKGSLYNYFRNKEELYFAIIIYRLNHLLALLQKRIHEHAHPLVNLRRTIVHIYSFFQKYPHFFKIWLKEKAKLEQYQQSEICQLHQQIRKVMIDVLKEGAAAGMLIPHPPEFVGDMILGMIDSAIIRGRNFSADQRREERIRLFEFVLSAVGTREALKLHQMGIDEPQKQSGIHDAPTKTYIDLSQR